jgi:flagellar biosynthesis/type III secretory pathway chaperone
MLEQQNEENGDMTKNYFELYQSLMAMLRQDAPHIYDNINTQIEFRR